MEKEARKEDLERLSVIYDQFLDNYDGLNKTFSFNDCREINSLYTFMSNKGYLSMDKKLYRDTNGSIDYPLFYGVDVLNGHAVCRHFSFMLAEILNKQEIDAREISTSRGAVYFNVYDNPKSSMTRNEMYEIVNKNVFSEEERKSTYEYIDKYYGEFNNFLVNYDLPNLIRRLFPDHSVVACVQDKKAFVFDAFNKDTFKLSSIKKNVISNENNMPLCLDNTILTFIKDNRLYREQKWIFSHDKTTFSEDREVVSRCQKTYMDNLDILDKFYKDNSPIYDEVREKALVLTKKHVK